MQIDDLPRLTEQERELADDEYVVMPAAVPANLSIDDLIAQRTAALDAAVGTNPPPADLSSPERWRDRVLLGLADGRVAKVDVGKPYVNAKRLVLGFLSRLRQRRQQRLLARAQEWLDACQCAAENYPGMYDDIEREAELAVAKLKEANRPQKQ